MSIRPTGLNEYVTSGVRACACVHETTTHDCIQSYDNVKKKQANVMSLFLLYTYSLPCY